MKMSAAADMASPASDDGLGGARKRGREHMNCRFGCFAREISYTRGEFSLVERGPFGMVELRREVDHNPVVGELGLRVLI